MVSIIKSNRSFSYDFTNGFAICVAHIVANDTNRDTGARQSRI